MYKEGKMKLICNKYLSCHESLLCGGSQPHDKCTECNNCPRDKYAKCEKVEISDWIIIDEYCAMKIIKDSNPDLIKNRLAFIEKTPRIRIGMFVNNDTDYQNWKQGPKGEGGCIEDDPDIYGFYQPSRDWCDKKLKEIYGK